jgi:hypothetical protein
MSRLGEVAVSRRKHSQCTAMPSAISTANDTGIIHSGDRPATLATIQVRNAPTIRNSPWAMFRMRISPYCRFRPRATSA